MSDIATQLLARVAGGDDTAAEELLPLVYEQLRGIASGILRGQQAHNTLQPTALLHEAYIKLVRSERSWDTRAHFCAVASIAMRQILSNHARDKRAVKRGGNFDDVTLSGVESPAGQSTIDLVALDDALVKLERLNGRYARLVELRFFGGLTVDEIAGQLDISPRTVKADWRAARAWLGVELSGEGAR